ncbi:hypothetical protein AAHC03_0214 [Spirometra sp. Aus1]
MDVSARPRRPDKPVYQPPSKKTSNTNVGNTEVLSSDPVLRPEADSVGRGSSRTSRVHGRGSSRYPRGRRCGDYNAPNYVKKDASKELPPGGSRQRGAYGGHGQECYRESNGGFRSSASTRREYSPKGSRPQEQTKPLSSGVHVAKPASHSPDLPSLGDDGITFTDEKHAPKHGGLIHLPKNVNLNPTSEESVERSFQSQIRSRGGHTKPVVVVHPHLKIAHTGQREVPQSPQYSAPPQQGPKVAGHNQFSDCKRSVNEGAPLSATATSSIATPVRTATYPGVSPLTAGLNLLSLAGKVPDNCVAPENAFSSLPYTALHAVPPAQLVNKPPSPAVAEIVLQIVQMDAALTALMIPPGQCAFGLQPLPDEATNTEMTEPEKLFLRWWDTVEKLRGSLLLAFERVILEDLDFCNSAHVEQGMWKSVFYAVLESLRTWQNNPYLTA